MNDAIIERITKILALANDKAAQPGEIEAALAKAKELAIRHSIDIGSIDSEKNGKSKTVDGIVTDTSLNIKSKYEQPYHPCIYRILEDCFDVKIIRRTTGAKMGACNQLRWLYIIGDPTDVAIAKAIFPWLQKLFPASLTEQVKAGRLTYSMAHTNGWYYGLEFGICKANKREKDKLSAQDQQTYAMVVRDKNKALDDYIEKEFPNLIQSKPETKSFDGIAIAMGMERGRKINLNQVK